MGPKKRTTVSKKQTTKPTAVAVQRGRYGGVCHCTHVAFGQVKENTQVGNAAMEMIRNGSI